MLFKMVDTDNSGNLSLDEFKVLHEIIVKDEQARAANIKELDATVTRNRETIIRLRKVVLAAFLFCCAFLGIIGGMTVGVVKGFKDTEAKAATSILYTSNGTKIITTNPVLADNYGNVMETAPAIVALPMRAAVRNRRRIAVAESVPQIAGLPWPPCQPRLISPTQGQISVCLGPLT